MTPSRSAVARALGACSGAVRACLQPDGPRTVRARVVFVPAGNLKVVEVLDGVVGPVARCVEQAVLPAQVPPFRQDEFRVIYPYRR